MTEQLYRSRCLPARLQPRRCSPSTSAAASCSTARSSTPPPAGSRATSGSIELEGGDRCPIATTVYDADKTDDRACARRMAQRPAAGQTVRAVLDWDTRARLMRMHTCLHLLCALVKFPVTGGQVSAEDSRLDFDIEDASAVDKDTLDRRPQRADRRQPSGQRALDQRRRARGQPAASCAPCR